MPSLLTRLQSMTKFDCALVVAMLAYIVLSSTLAIQKHYAFLTTAWDLGIYEQVMWSTVNSDKLFWYTVELPINPSGSFFGIHFAPFLFAILPIYWAFQTTETLLIIQSTFLALGALPLYLMVKDVTSKKGGFVFACLYLLYPPLHGMTLFDFHVQAFLPLFFLFALYYFKRQKWGLYFFFTILALSTVEFVPFLVIFMGLYGLWTCRKKIMRTRITEIFSNTRFLTSTLTIILAISWFLMARSVLFYYNPEPRPHPNWAEFGDPLYDLPGLLLSIISNPIQTIQTIFSPLNEKVYYIIGLFAPVGFLSFLSPPSLLIGTPWFLASLLSNQPIYYNPIGYQYVGFTIPFIFLSAFYGSRRLLNLIQLHRDRIRITWAAKHLQGLTLNKVFLSMLLITCLYLAILGGSLTLPHITLHDQILEDMVQKIPLNASVLTQNDIFPHLSKRLYGYVGNNPVGNFSNIEYDYILVDTTSGWYYGGEDFSQLPLQHFVPKAFESGEYGLVTAVDGIWLLKRNYEGDQVFQMKEGILGEFSYDNSTEIKFQSIYLDTDWDWTTLPGRLRFSTLENSTWSATFSSYLTVETKGDYQFTISSSGTCRLYINQNLLLNLDAEGNEQESQPTNEITLEEGVYQIKIEYTKNEWPEYLKVTWKTPTNPSHRPISHDNLLWDVT